MVRRFAILSSLALVAACDCGGGASSGNMLALTPDLLDLGEVAVGLASRRTLVLENRGPATVRILEIRALDALADEVRIDGFPAAILPGKTYDLEVVFTPLRSGERDGQIVVRSDSAPEAFARIIGRAIDPSLETSSDLVDFGRIIIGKTATASLQVSNHGDVPVTIRALSPDPMTSSEFSGILGGIVTLEPNETVDILLTYRPQNPGFDAGSILLVDDTALPTRVGVRVRGEGITDEIVADPDLIVFTGVFSGESRDRIFDIRNVGSSTHTIEGIGITSSDPMPPFLIITSTASDTPFVLLPGEEHRIGVRFQPFARGDFEGRVEVRSSTLRSPVIVSLFGTSLAPPRPVFYGYPSTLEFGGIERNVPARRRLSIVNEGTADGHVTSVSIVPSVAGVTIIGSPEVSSTFAPKDEHVVTVEVTTNVAIQTSVVFLTDDELDPELIVPIRAGVVASAVPHLEVDRAPLAFGTMERDEYRVRSAILENVGTATLTVSGLSLFDDGGGLFAIEAVIPVPFAVAPGRAFPVPISFVAVGNDGITAGLLEINSNDAETPTVNVPLTVTSTGVRPGTKDIVVYAEWDGDRDINLHLLRDGGALFDRPSDCCFCSPNPNWGALSSPFDDPSLERNDFNGIPPETVAIRNAARGTYALVVHHRDDRGAGSADVRVIVQSRGAILAVLSRTVGPKERWEVGTVTLDGHSTGTFSPAGELLSIELDGECH